MTLNTTQIITQALQSFNDTEQSEAAAATSVNNSNNTPNTMSDISITDEQIVIVNKMFLVLCYMSLGCCTLSLIIFGMIRTHPRHSHFVNRVSIRLTVAALSSALMYQSFQLVMVSEELIQPGFLCSFIVWGSQAANMCSTLCLTSVAVNLQLVLHRTYQMETSMPIGLEKWYYMISLGSPMVLVTIPTFFGTYGFVNQNGCWYGANGRTAGFFWEIGSYYSVIAAATVYILVVMVIVGRQLLRERRKTNALQRRRISTPYKVSTLSENSDVIGSSQIQEKKLVLGMMSRVAIYPLIIIIANFMQMTNDILTYLRMDQYFALYFMDSFCAGVWGIVLSAYMLADPSMRRGAKDVLSEWWFQEVDCSTCNGYGCPTCRRTSVMDIIHKRITRGRIPLHKGAVFRRWDDLKGKRMSELLRDV